MDTESVSARLDRICVRLDQIQNQNVDVLEMKTQIKEMMAAQNGFQSQLTKLLISENDTLTYFTDKHIEFENTNPQIITTLHQEKMFMRAQLTQAQQEILYRLTDIQTKIADCVNSSMISENNKMLNQITESMNMYSDIVMDIKAKITEKDSELKLLRTEISCIRESPCMIERSRGCKYQVDNTKLNENMEQMAFKIDTFQSEVRNMQAEFKGMAKAEFVWLERMIDNKLADILSSADTNLQVTGEVNLKLEPILASLNSLHDDVHSLNTTSACEAQNIKTQIDRLNLKEAEPYSALSDHLHSVSDKIHDSVIEILEKYDKRTIKQLEVLKSQNDSIRSLQKQIEDLRQLNFDIKEAMETEAKGKTEDIMKCFTELKENVKGVTSNMHQHFRETLPKACDVVRESICTEITVDTHKLSNLIMTAQKELLKQAKDNAGSINKEMSNTKEKSYHILSIISNVQENIDVIRNQVNTVETIVNKVEKKIQTTGDKVDKNVEAIVNKFEKILKEEVNMLTEKQSEVVKQHEKSFNDVKDLLEQTKHEIWAMTEKEAQLVRDRIEGPLPSHGKYTFYFYVLDFKSLVRSGKIIQSLPWHINEIKSCVQGMAFLSIDGQLEVWLMHGRHPLCVGLQPVTSDKKLEVKATICDIRNKTLPDQELGKKIWTTDETGNLGHIHQSWGTQLAVTSCDDLVQKGYGDKEGYSFGTVLIRYDVTVV